MKETYFLIERDYLHIIRLLNAAWSNQKPKQLEVIVTILREKHFYNGVLTRIAS